MESWFDIVEAIKNHPLFYGVIAAAAGLTSQMVASHVLADGIRYLGTKTNLPFLNEHCSLIAKFAAPLAFLSIPLLFPMDPYKLALMLGGLTGCAIWAGLKYHDDNKNISGKNDKNV
ncbi:MAG: hypothetical protein N3A71_03315 [Candidatus Dojkabacteria bacterium]|nr:hypothetical protein [Candidatus Dojkabacteria bacterium]